MRILVDAMGGTICFDSKQGVGTTFYITIPFRICDAPQAAEAQQSQEPQEAQAAISLSGLSLQFWSLQFGNIENTRPKAWIRSS